MAKQDVLSAEPGFAQIVYYGLMLISLCIFVGFSYISFLAYRMMAGQFSTISYVIVAPIFVSAFLFIILVMYGRHHLHKELGAFKKYGFKATHRHLK